MRQLLGVIFLVQINKNENISNSKALKHQEQQKKTSKNPPLAVNNSKTVSLRQVMQKIGNLLNKNA